MNKVSQPSFSGQVAKSWRFVAALALLLVCGAMLAPTAVFAQDKGALFINVSSEDPWKVSMAAFFGTNFALKDGYKPVVVFVNTRATPFFTKNQSAVRTEQFGRTVHEMYREFQGAGGRILICPICMKPLNISASDLIDGAEVATVKSVNEVLFRPDTKVMSW